MNQRVSLVHHRWVSAHPETPALGTPYAETKEHGNLADKPFTASMADIMSVLTGTGRDDTVELVQKTILSRKFHCPSSIA